MKYIKIRGAREHNLKNFNIDIPKDKFIVITGISGSGKSSLAFDTIYSEGQRRYVESLSTYARQFLGKMEKPNVDLIEGLSPAISIEQKTTNKNPRSTVGTITEIYDYLRLLYARVGVPYCPSCNSKIQALSVDQMIERIFALPENTKIQVLSPQIIGKKGEHKDLLETIHKKGFHRVRINDEIRTLDEDIKLRKNYKSTIEIVVDRLVLNKTSRSRLADSIEIALKESEGTLIIFDGMKDHIFSQKFACLKCNSTPFQEINHRSFSFNSPYGACPSCEGLGQLRDFHESSLIQNKDQPILNKNCLDERIEKILKRTSFSKIFKEYLNIAWKQLPDYIQQEMLYGQKDFLGIIPILREEYGSFKYQRYSRFFWIEQYLIDMDCNFCQGKRLKKEILAIKVNDISIDQYTDFSIEEALDFTKSLKFYSNQKIIAEPILKEIVQRLTFLKDIGAGYLTLSRKSGTLSGGEFQRIRLATQIGSHLTGVLYVLDEPSIGLHQRDNSKLITTLKKLRDLGNTIIVVEHDFETMQKADHIIEIGPKAGIHGGKLVVSGNLEEVKQNKNSITGKYLSGELNISVPKKRRNIDTKRVLSILGASENNLKNVNVDIPLGVLNVVTGVSGSGKSTLINEVLYKIASRYFYFSRQIAGKHKEIQGLSLLDKVINIDQSPIGRTPRSNPATYTDIFILIREIFFNVPEAKIRGYDIGRFSFNKSGGRCENCEGDGILKIEMHFLPDVYATCEHCKGKRYNQETLSIRYKGKNISDVLQMTVAEAQIFFDTIPSLKSKLSTLSQVGLEYIQLGQPSTTLSGGEAQRIKLSKELSKRSTNKTLYILDEPTTGLHFEDIKKLLSVLQSLVDKGNTVIVIEHNLDVIKQADWIIDLGPEGGTDGGKKVAEGTPEQVAKVKESYTGFYLDKILNLNVKF